MYSEQKKDWPEGPWTTEPDRVEWKDPETGLACMLIRNRQGVWCGYVGVPPGHRFHKKDYNDVDVEVHGGLTYSAECSGHICHVPAPGEPEHLWWLGFDCGHAFDLCPGMEALRLTHGWPAHDTDVYRDIEYVKNEVTNLARQIS